MKGSDYIIQFLTDHNIHHMFGYPGAVVCHLMDSAYKNKKMNLHLNYHEQASAFSACGYAMATGKVCVAYANGGPGMTNLVTGIADAWYDSLPVIFIVGQVDTTAMRNELLIRQRGIQEIPSAKIVKEIVKYSEVIKKKEDLRYCLERAYYEVTNGRPGPVLLEIPADIQRSEIDEQTIKGYENNSKKKSFVENFNILENAINDSKRPVIIIGNGVRISESYSKLPAMVNNLKIPIVTTLLALDCLPYDNPYYFGFIGNNGNRYGNFILGKSDLIISIGCRMDVKVVGNDRNTFARNAKIIRIDIDEKELTYKIRDDEIAINEDAGKIIDFLTTISNKNIYTDWLNICYKLKNKFYGYDFKQYHKTLQKLLNKAENAGCFTTDVGQHEIYTLQALQLKIDQHIAISSGLASMGFGIPSAIGAYYASEKPVVCVCGDGGFLMNVQELQYIFREKIPVKIIVFNNNALGMIREFQTRNFDGKCIHSIAKYGYECPNIKAIAESYGLKYEKVISNSDVDKIDMNSFEPIIVEFFVDEPTELYPRFKRGENVQNMLPEISKEDYEWAMNL